MNKTKLLKFDSYIDFCDFFSQNTDKAIKNHILDIIKISKEKNINLVNETLVKFISFIESELKNLTEFGKYILNTIYVKYYRGKENDN